ncbi:MAG TPA: HPF/RaiA family ribosome-associated protein [Kiloniellales bacterium]
MDVPLELSFRNMDASDTVEAKVRERVDKLEKYFGRINSCRVMVEAPHRSHRKGKVYHVRIEIGVPGRTLIVDRDPGQHHAHEDVYVALRDAFDAARRKLEDHSRKVAGRTKAHAVPLHGTISVLNGLQGYGIASMPDGQEIYFHRNSVANDGFANLEVGDEVRLVIAEGESDKGPQASTVTPIGKHHLTER